MFSLYMWNINSKRNERHTHTHTDNRHTHTFGADEAPADIDVAVVAVGLFGVEVVGADNGTAGDHLTTCCHALLPHVVGHGAAQTAH